MQTTKSSAYTDRLKKSGKFNWKNAINAQAPYRWNLKRIRPGKTIDIGCGVGRNLINLPAGSIGLDHNKYSIDYLNKAGFRAYLPKDFKKTNFKIGSFDSLLLSHVLEHMKPKEATDLIKEYLPYLKKGGQLIIFCPQEKGYKSDKTHVTFLDIKALNKIIELAGFNTRKVSAYSFPLPRFFGKIFTYNEFVLIAKK